MKPTPVLICTASLLLAAPICASAQAICRSYEYAELKDMSKDLLLEKYCDYKSDMYSMLSAGASNSKAGYGPAANSNLAISNRCAQEQERVGRVLDAKFGIKNAVCPAKSETK